MKWSAPVAVIFALPSALRYRRPRRTTARSATAAAVARRAATAAIRGSARDVRWRSAELSACDPFPGAHAEKSGCRGAGPGVQSAARSTVGPSAPARSAGVRQRISCDRFGCHCHVQSWQPIPGRNCVSVPHGIHLTGKGGINKTGWARRQFYRCA